jgi:hypothetical protein
MAKQVQQVLEFVTSRGFQSHLDPNNPQQTHFSFKFGQVAWQLMLEVHQRPPNRNLYHPIDPVLLHVSALPNSFPQPRSATNSESTTTATAPAAHQSLR